MNELGKNISQQAAVNANYPQLLEMVPAPTDADIAKELREETRSVLEHLCRLQSRANASGMRLEFQLGIDAFGRQIVGSLNVLKVL